MNKISIFVLVLIFLTPILILLSAKSALASGNVEGWAWSENIGWISLNSTNCDADGDGFSDGIVPGCPPAGTPIPDYGVNLDLSNGKLSGYAWSENIGWIKFDPVGPYPDSPNYSACINLPDVSGEVCEADLSENEVGGWIRALAYSDGWDGWIKLRGTTEDGNTYGVYREGKELRGWAWGGDVVGWISFNCKDRGICYIQWQREANWDVPYSGTEPSLALGDLDNDGDLDLMVGQFWAGTPIIAFENIGSSSSPVWQRKQAWDTGPIPGCGIGPCYINIALIDINNDGKLDLFVSRAIDNAGDSATIAYENTGTLSAPSWTRNSAWDPPGTQELGYPRFADLDLDGDFDFLFGDERWGDVAVYENTGSSSAPSWTRNSAWDPPSQGQFAGETFFIDVDGDQDYDLIGPQAYKNYQKENCLSSPQWISQSNWNTGGYHKTLGDLNNDGYPDLLTVGAGDNQTPRAYRNAASNYKVTIYNYSPKAATLGCTAEYCSSAIGLNPGEGLISFQWTYSDPDGDNETEFDFRVNDINDVNDANPEINVSSSCLNNPPGTVNNQTAIVGKDLNYNTTYYWWVRVWDSAGNNSGWVQGPNFDTPSHAYPYVDFSWTPTSPNVDETVNFKDKSITYVTYGKTDDIKSWSWTFQDATPASSTEQNPSVIFNSKGDKSVTLTVTDRDNFQCSKEKTVPIQFAIPQWQEIPPISYLRPFLASLARRILLLSPF